MAAETFDEKKRRLASAGRLFEDRDFPPSGRSLRRDWMTPRGVRWLRPKQISNSPKFVIQGATKFDLYQGELGDCWFVAAVACLADTSNKMLQRIVPHDQSFEENYAGMFRFKFWNYEKWVEVVIDDLLPTRNGELVYAQNRERLQQNEFWPALVEKAYAKLYGCYENVHGGHINNALVDFTGGISEHVDLEKKASLPKNLFHLMQQTMRMNSMMGCSCSVNAVAEADLGNGIYANHAYSITSLATIGSENVLRLRNPWGRTEWKGRWSDRSNEWQRLSESDKRKLGLRVRNDGEFWMSYDDWIQIFHDLNICHLYPDALTKEVAENLEKASWDSISFHNSWVRGVNAGGCGNVRPDLFWTNPQYAFHLKEKNDGDADGNCTMVVSLMQKVEDLKYDLRISFQVWKLKSGYPVLLDGKNYDRRALRFSRVPAIYTNVREVTAHMELEPGTYIVIPSTFDPNMEGEFLLRVYTEKKAAGEVIDDISTVPSKPETDNLLEDLFKKHAAGGLQMDGEEFMAAINDHYKERIRRGFGIETARSLLAMVDKNQSGMLTESEFVRACKELNVWTSCFQQFDTDNSDSIDSYEMKKVFETIGFKLSRKVLLSIVRRYGGKTRRLKVEDFVHACSKIISMYEQFHKYKNNATNKAELGIDEWLAVTTLY